MRSLPQTMRAVRLTHYGDPGPQLQIETLPLPALRSGDVLIRIAAAPINPSDLIFLRGEYGVRKTLPVTPGFEGSGTVVASGGGFYGACLVGRRVACRAPEDGNGTWAQYMAAPTHQCIPLLPSVSLEQGAMLIVNPLTAWALIQKVQQEDHETFLQTAAASALGLMLARLARRENIPAIHIVRRPEQAALLRDIGAETVIDSSAADFTEQLNQACDRLQPSIAFDAVSGPLTAQITAALPKGAKMVTYGALSGADAQINPLDLIFKEKTLEGFWLSRWVKNLSGLDKFSTIWQVQRRLSDDLSSRVQARFPLDQFQEAMARYKAQRTDGKVLLIP